MPDRQRLPRPAEDHLLVGDEPGQPHRMDSRFGAHALRRRFAVPDGASRFVSACSSTISARGNAFAAAAEAHHQDRPLGEVRRVEARHSGFSGARIESLEVEARRPDHHGHARADTLPDIGDDCVRVWKSTAASQPSGPWLRASTISCPTALSGAENHADLPLRSVERDPHRHLVLPAVGKHLRRPRQQCRIGRGDRIREKSGRPHRPGPIPAAESRRARGARRPAPQPRRRRPPRAGERSPRGSGAACP